MENLHKVLTLKSGKKIIKPSLIQRGFSAKLLDSKYVIILLTC